MLISFTRTVILYFLVVLALRLMGKRQVGELQPSELVVAIMISDLATIPMSDISIPLLYGIIPILTLVCAEVTLSFLCLKSQRIRGAVTGKPTYIISNGEFILSEMVKARYTLSDLLEELRMMDIFDVSTVHSAILETNGKISVVTKDRAGEKAHVLVCDGKIQEYTLSVSPFDEKDLKRFLKGKDIRSVFILSVSESGEVFCVLREECQ